MSNRLSQIKNVYDTANPNVNKGTKSEDTLTKGIPDSERAGNRATYLYNKILEGVGSVASGLGDVATQGASIMSTGQVDASPVTRKLYREQIAPSVRDYLKETIGANVDKNLESKYDRETLTGALGGLAQSAPAIAATLASGGIGTGAMFLQSYDNALESINQTEAGQSLDEGTKTFFAGGVGLVTSALEKYGLDKIFKGETGVISNAIARKAIKEATEESGGKVTGDLFTKFLDKEVLNLTNKYVKGGVKALDGALVEYGTEALQEGAQAGAELLVNKATGKPVFDTSETGTWGGFLRRMNKAGIAGAIGGGLLGSVAALGGVKNADIENNTTRLNEVNTALQNDQLSDVSREVLVQEKIKLQDEIQKSADKIDEAYDKLDDKQKERVNEIVDEKVKLQEVLADENVPESIKENVTKQNEALDKELGEIKPVEAAKTPETTETLAKEKEVVTEAKNGNSQIENNYLKNNRFFTDVGDSVHNKESFGSLFSINDNGEVDLDLRKAQKIYTGREFHLDQLYNKQNTPDSPSDQTKINVIKKPVVEIKDGKVNVIQKGEVSFGDIQKETVNEVKSTESTSQEAAPKAEETVAETGKETINKGGTENAIQEQSTGGVLQRQQEETGTTGGERGGMEQGKQGEETTTAPTPKEVQSNDEQKVTGITQEATGKARETMGIEVYEKTSQSNEQRRAKAEKAIKEGYDVKKLVNNIKSNEDFVPSRQEMEILKIYENSLDASINKNPTTEKIAERADLLRTVDIGTSRAGAALQAVAGVEASVDNLANFLQAEAVHYGVDKLPQNIIDDLKGKYEKGQEAKQAYEEGYKKAKDELIKQQAEEALAKQRKKTKPSVKKSSADYASERAELKQSIKDKLKKSRGQLNAVPVPYLNELIAIAPDVAKLVKSYVEEGVSKLDDIVKRVHKDLQEDIEDITEQDVIDLISGQYNAKRPTKTEILSQVRDLREQAKLLKKIDDLENGKVPTDPVKQVRRNADLEALRKQVKELEDETGVTEQRTLKTRRTALDNKIKQLQDDLETGNFDLEPAEPRKVRLDAETQKKQDEYIAFLKETNRRRDQAVYEQQSKITKAWLKFQQVLGLRRLIQTSIDFSMPFRQAVTVTLNPRYAKTTLESFANMFKSTFSEKKYDRIMFDIQQDPLYHDMKSDGLMFSEVDSKDNLKREEDYRTSFLYQIPYLREPFLASNRAAAGYINTARYNLYLKGVERLRAQGITHENSPENYAALAKWVMNMTGRGNLLDFMEKGENASKWQRIMGDTFYGTRLMASRFNMLNPNYYLKMPKEQRVEALKDIGSYVALSAAVAAAAVAAGAKVSTDPEDADFLKAKWGDKRYDIFSGGMNTYLRTAYRLMKAMFQRTNPKLYGENKDKSALKKANKYGSFAVKSGTDFFRYKLAPNTSYVLSATLGKDPLGKDFDPKDILKFYPMYVDDLKDAMKKDDAGLESLSILAPSLFGIGVQEYSNKKKPTKEKE